MATFAIEQRGRQLSDFERYAWAVPAIVLALCAGCGALFSEVLHQLQWPAMALSVVILGFPHGALDLTALGGRSDIFQSLRTKALYCLGYVALAALVVVLWFSSPLLGLVFFLALTAWHWGEGDAWLAFPDGRAKVLAALGRGLILMGAPLMLQSEGSRQVLQPLQSLGISSVALDSLIYFAPFLVVGGLFLKVLVALSCDIDTAKAWFLGAETVLLIAFWNWVPPLFGVAIYLSGVHAWRHLLRLQTSSERAKAISPSRIPIWQLIGWQRNALWPTLSALIFVPAMLWLWPSLQSGPLGWSWAYLILIAGLTLPHAATVSWLSQQNRL